MSALIAGLFLLSIAIFGILAALHIKWRDEMKCPHLARNQLTALYASGLMSDLEYAKEMQAIERWEDGL